MDRDFHNDDFERLLREKSDEFRMYPSQRIWHSIYNNIHPGRKWPSVVMSITLITSLFLIGYLNSGNTNLYPNSENNTFRQNTIDQIESPQFIAQKNTSFTDITNNSDGNLNESKKDDLVNNGIASNQVTSKPSVLAFTSVITQMSVSASDAHNNRSGFKESSINNATIPFASSVQSELTVSQINVDAEIEGNKITTAEYGAGFLTYDQKTRVASSIENLPLVYSAATEKAVTTKTVQPVKNESLMAGNATPRSNSANSISKEDKNWIENYALYHRPATKKWANKLAFQMYATPSVVYRTLYDETIFGNNISAAPFAIATPSQNIDDAVVQKPSLGFEIGTGFQYKLFKVVKLKAGLQLNYTRYNSQAFQNTHPVATQLTMNDYETNTSYQVYRSTAYSNKSGLEAVNLHNETFQFSIPIGVDLKLMGNESLAWNIGATIQPTYVPVGKSYLISSDRYNYVKETSMINRWNVNAGFETFISYKVNGLTWQLGPQFRTQLISTNSKNFAVKEKLVNYGLKVGVTKTIK